MPPPPPPRQDLGVVTQQASAIISLIPTIVHFTSESRRNERKKEREVENGKDRCDELLLLRLVRSPEAAAVLPRARPKSWRSRRRRRRRGVGRRHPGISSLLPAQTHSHSHGRTDKSKSRSRKPRLLLLLLLLLLLVVAPSSFPTRWGWGRHETGPVVAAARRALRILSENQSRRGVLVFRGLSQDTFLLYVRKEIQRCYALVQKLGRGVIYLGSSRVKTNHPHYLQALELAREVAKMLDCTTWTGAGPGFMDAAIRGAFEAKKPAGGFKIARESGEWTSSNFHPYLPPDTYLTCRFFSARKHGLVDAAVRNNPTDKTAVVAFPGGIGTLDEVFEILALIQLERIGSKLPVPFLLVNYDSYYSKLVDFMDECEKWGAVAEGEVASLCKVCSGNVEALEYLAEFYDLPTSKTNYDPMDGVQKV